MTTMDGQPMRRGALGQARVAGRALALAAALWWVGLSGLGGLAGSLNAGDAAAGGDQTVRMGVVRLQEIVERYNRYIYVTARFSEDFKKLFNQHAKVMDTIDANLQKLTETKMNPIDVAMNEAEFQKRLAEESQLKEQKLQALVVLRDLSQLKEDLNTVMSLATMDDIAKAVESIAKSKQLDYVTDYFPVDRAQRQMAGAAREKLDQSSMILLENLQNRAPTLYANPELDVTEAVVKYLNDKYSLTHGVDGQPDPLLTEPLSKLAAGMKTQREAFEAAQANRKVQPMAAPFGTGYAYGVVNLQTVITTMTKLRRYDFQFEDLNKKMEALKNDLNQQGTLYKDRLNALQNDLKEGRAVPKEKQEALNKAGEDVANLQRNVLNLTLEAQALSGAAANKLFDEITAEVNRQAAAAHIQLVVATFSDEKSQRAENVERAIDNKNMVVWHRRQAPIDLTLSVLQALAEQHQRYQAELIKSGQKANPFDLPKSAKDTVNDFVTLARTVRAEEEAEDKRKFQLWHDYQRDVLKVTPETEPTSDTTPKPTNGAATDATGAAGTGVVQPDPKPLNP